MFHLHHPNINTDANLNLDANINGDANIDTDLLFHDIDPSEMETELRFYCDRLVSLPLVLHVALGVIFHRPLHIFL
jgi:hypothetical protein